MWESKYVKGFDGSKIQYYYVRGNKITLVFVHGGMVNSLCWKYQYAYFKSKGYGVLALDLRGHGSSKGKLRASNLHSHAKDIEQVLHKEKIPNTVLIGHSFGTLVSLTYYKDYPRRVRALVLLAGSLIPNLSLVQQIKRLFQLYARVKKAKKKHRQYERIGKKTYPSKMFHPSLLSLIQNARALKKVSPSLYQRVKVPTLVVAAKNDEFFSPAQVKQSTKLLSHRTFKILPGPHLFILKEREKVNKTIEAFIRRIEST